MEVQFTLDDVVAAGRVLFGPAFRAEGEAWRQDLKTTYRRRALETHPDRARTVGRSESALAAEFRRVAEAYRVLSQLAAGPLPAAPDPPAPPGPQRPRQRAAPPPAAAAAASPGRQAPGQRVRYSVHPEAMPRRKLRFAEFLYYSGRVPWTSFVEAITWQRRQRPPVGRIAVEFGFLEPEDVGRIMEERRVQNAQSVPFGEFAVRMGYLTSFQLLAVLGRQLRLQKRIGAFFVEHGFIEAEEIDDIRRRVLRHNVRWRD
ncbi:MAG TPA: DnaJ domain-containing protein [Anaeromyxobacter sp.]|nr:DnaJ domain-containing protein [Anaeromyxobacter sp.]